MPKIKLVLKLLVVFGYLLLLIGCSSSTEKRPQVLYQTYCATCHLLPDIQDLPKQLWKDKVLPEMGARMGIRDSTYNPYKGYSFDEQYAMIKSGVYSVRPSISKENWDLLVDYVVLTAPDNLKRTDQIPNAGKITQFRPSLVNLDSTGGSFFTLVEYDARQGKLITGDLQGRIFEYDADTKEVLRNFGLGNAITSSNKVDSTLYITTVGKLDPSEIPSGSIHCLEDGSGRRLPFEFHRPVHTLVNDFDQDGYNEIVVCEFGNLTGKLTLLARKNDSVFEKRTLLNRPGAVRTISYDMDLNGKKDIVVMTAQGNEGISIFYQLGKLEFREEQVVRFGPAYGSSWFELLDYDGDGDQDLITVHGDNGDKTPILKPYHGLRIHLNDGTNHFSEDFFYPFYGATRSVSKDFDQDGDIDIALISTFPDYDTRPEQSFVFLENENSSEFDFKPLGLPEDLSGRWFLMDAGDFDHDGDDDIVLSCFTYSFAPLPEDLKQKWHESEFDMVILENKLLE